MIELLERLNPFSKAPVLGEEYHPSITKQSKWPCGFYNFPGINRGTVFYNCAVIDWLSQRWLITRRQTRRLGFKDQNDIVFWTLRDNRPILPYPVKIFASHPGENWEDPRVLIRRGGLILTYANFLWNSYVHQAVAEVGRNFVANHPVHFVYGSNGQTIRENKTHEKNWAFFEFEERLHFVYLMDPHTVVKTENAKVLTDYMTDGFRWEYGEARGGTPPIRIGDEYWGFFHSSLDNPKRRRRYYMGAYAFEAKPPFKITRYTPEPLLAASEDDPVKDKLPYCVFPCGAILERDKSWLVTGGCNDCRCFWIRIPHSELVDLTIST